MNAGRPISAAHSASQAARSRLVSSGGRPPPARQGSGQRVGDVASLGLVLAGEEVLPGERGCFQQPGLVAGEHRHRPRRAAADFHDDAA
jgi:hypothetical protein